MYLTRSWQQFGQIIFNSEFFPILLLSFKIKKKEVRECKTLFEAINNNLVNGFPASTGLAYVEGR